MLAYKAHSTGQFGGHAIGFVHVGHVAHECRLHVGNGPADSQRQLAKFPLQRLALALQAFDHHVGGQSAAFRQLAQLPRGHAQAIGQGTGQAGCLLHDRVKFFTAQYARLQALNQLGDGGVRCCCASTRDRHCLVDGLRQRQALLGGLLQAQARILARLSDAGKQDARSLQGGVRAQGYGLHIVHRSGKVFAFARHKANARLQVLVGVG